MGLMIVILFLPIPIILGLVLLRYGWRGRPVLSEPMCAACGYDVRGARLESKTSCPECGADLEQRKAIRFGRYKRRPFIMALGALVLLLPVLLLVGSRYLMTIGTGPNPANVSGRSNASLISGFAANIDDPWISPELTRRAVTGALTPAEMQSIFDAYVAGLTARAPDNDTPLHWSGDLMKAVLADPARTDAQRKRLYGAFYKKPLEVTIPTRVRQGGKVMLMIKSGTHWGLPDVRQIDSLRRLELDGEALEFMAPGGRSEGDRHAYSPSPIWGSIAIDAAPGDHVVTIEVESGLVPVLPQTLGTQSSTSSRGANTLWPKAVHRWTRTIKLPIELVGTTESPIELVHDDSLASEIRKSVTPRAVIIERKDDRLQATLEVTHLRNPVVPLSFEAIMVVDGEEYSVGNFAVGTQTQRGSLVRWIRTPLPDTVRRAKLVLRPDPKEVEGTAGYPRIWGGELEYEVVVERHDLDL